MGSETKVNRILTVCIVKNNFVAQVVRCSNKDACKQRVISKGTIVETGGDILAEELTFKILIDESKNVCCQFYLFTENKRNLIPILSHLCQAISAIPSTIRRVHMAENKKLLYELSKIGVGAAVYLLPDTKSSEDSLLHAVVKYVGPVPEMGKGYYFGLEILEPGQGNSDGSIYGKRYFFCQKYSGIFVSLNRIRPRSTHGSSNGMSAISCTAKCNEVFTSSAYTYETISMPSSERKLCNIENSDFVNYKTTLVLKLKENNSMSRNLSPKVEKTEKLVDLEPNVSTPDSCNRFLKVGDRVVWVTDSGPEVGKVRWLGDHSEENLTNMMVGVEFENPVGSGTGCYNNKQHFTTEPSHGAFLPLLELMRADDFFSKPPDNMKKRNTNVKVGENFNESKPSLCGNVKYHSPSAYGADASESRLWNNTSEIVDLLENMPTESQCKENKASANHSDNVCRSEYVFSETSPYETNTVKIGNSERNCRKDTKNNNVVKRTVAGSYPNSDVNMKNYICADSSTRVSDQLLKVVKPNELNIRPSYPIELQARNGESCDTFINTWPHLDNGHPKHWLRDDQKTLRTTPVKGYKISNLREMGADDAGDSFFVSQSTVIPDLNLPRRFSPTSDVTAFFDDSDQSIIPADLEVGSVVEVKVNSKPHYGVIRWIGTIAEDKKKRKIAGIEMEEDHIGHSDGTFNDRRYFHCKPGKAMFISLNKCQKDGRFQDSQAAMETKFKTFGQMDCPIIPGVVPPIRWKGDMESICGKFRGIQGHHNSCYLDATLFGMFTFTSVFDSLLFRPPTENDIHQYEEVQRVLREEIVNPLRQNLYVRADRVMKLRTLLENLSSVTGLTSEEKDPEEFLTSLVAQILKAEPFLKLSSGQEAYHYQLFVEKDERLLLPSVQQLFDQSFLTSDIKLKEVPSCLIIQMPRFGKTFKMYPRILPSQLLDVTDIIEDSPRQCTVCGKLAEYECKECFGQFGSGLESIAFCEKCLETAHSHQRRTNHGWHRLSVPAEFSILQDHCHIPRLYMELFAVVCIETSHYVAFVKCGSGSEAPWCFFDSMADRKGEQNGYNIPEMVLCPKLPYWLSEEGSRSLQEIRDDRLLPEHAKRLLCDAYMCMYQSSDVMMYR